MSTHARLACHAVLSVSVLLPGLSSAEETGQRLNDSVSPFLQAHATDPIDWYPWGSAAVERAKDKKRPVFLLLGRSGSSKERSVERAFLEVADARETLQKKCVAVLVDRDERPDIDLALQIVARQNADVTPAALDGPLVALLTPDMRPTFVRPFTPDFSSDLPRLVRTMKESEIAMRADIVNGELEAAQRPKPGALSDALLARSLERTVKAFHALRGTYLRTPGRPSPAALRLLLAEAQRTRRPDLVRVASRALTTLGRSGLRDHVGGGFFRAAADADLSQPSFEKTLADNALLLDAYLRAYALTGEALPREVASDIADWASREMRDSSGAFIHALDAADERGGAKRYLWSGEELRQALGRDGATVFFKAYRLGGEGVLTLIASDGVAPRAQIERLRARQSQRPQQARDERIFAGENGLMIAALAQSARILNRPADLVTARRAAEAVIEKLGPAENLRRAARGTLPGGPGMLDDYAGLMLGLLALDEALPDARWTKLAGTLADEALKRFADPTGGFFMTQDAQAPVLVRIKSADDDARVSADALMAEALVRLEAVSGQKRYGQAARKTVEAFLGELENKGGAAMDGLMLAGGAVLAGTSGRTLSQASTATLAAREVRGPVSVQLALSSDRAQPQQKVDATLYLAISAPWEIVAAQTQTRELAPLSVTLLSADLEADPPQYPAGRAARRRWNPSSAPTLTGQASIVLPLRAPAGSRPGEHRVRLRVRYQRCDASECQPPESVTLEAPFTVVAPAGS